MNERYSAGILENRAWTWPGRFSFSTRGGGGLASPPYSDLKGQGNERKVKKICDDSTEDKHWEVKLRTDEIFSEFFFYIAKNILVS